MRKCRGIFHDPKPVHRRHGQGCAAPHLAGPKGGGVSLPCGSPVTLHKGRMARLHNARKTASLSSTFPTGGFMPDLARRSLHCRNTGLWERGIDYEGASRLLLLSSGKGRIRATVSLSRHKNASSVTSYRTTRTGLIGGTGEQAITVGQDSEEQWST